MYNAGVIWQCAEGRCGMDEKIAGGDSARFPKPGQAAASILSRAFAKRSDSVEPGAAVHERLLRCIACDYGTHALVLETLIELLVKKGLVDEDEFEELLNAIDARDGKLDGMLGQPGYIGEGI